VHRPFVLDTLFTEMQIDMKHMLRFALALLVVFLCAPGFAVRAEPAEKRIALVIGNASYQAGALPTTANDAGLIAQTLQAAGFDTVGARDLDEDSLRHAFRDFVEKASAAGPDAVAFVYFSGNGLQLEGENYVVPVDAAISRDADIASKAVRISDYIRPLTALQLKATIIVLDAARTNPFTISGQPIAGGLALVEPSPGMLIAFNAAPGTIAPEQPGPYGSYAQALAEMIRQGGLSLGDVFERVRLRVNELTKGAEVPWNASRLETSFVFFERAPDAPPLTASAEQTSAIRSGPIRDLGPQEAYHAALERDTLAGYEDFLAAYPNDPMAKRARALVAARREALTWRRTYIADTPNAYWSYLRRYPRGPHVPDAHRRLAQLAAAPEPPRAFAAIDYDVPPPPPDEGIYVDRPVLAFDDPDFDFAPPPPPPFYLLPPPPPEFVVLAPPPPPDILFVLPVPVFVPIPVWCRPPVYVAAPPNNVIFNNIHNTVVVNRTTNVVTITNPSGQIVSATPRPAAGGVAAGIGPALPPAVARKAALIQDQKVLGPGARPGVPGGQLPATQLPPSQALPGSASRPLPSLTGRPAGIQGSPGTPPPGTAVPPRVPANTGRQPTLPAATLPTPPGSSPVVPGHDPAAAGAHRAGLPAGTPSAPHVDGHTPPSPAVGIRNQATPPAHHPQGTNGSPPVGAAAIHNVLPPGGLHHAPPPPSVTVHRPAALPPAAAAVHTAPPPVAVHRPPPPPGPAIHNSGPPPMVNRAPPPAAMNRAPPPVAAARANTPAPAAHRSCQVVNGRPVCN
jgi:uncharacterized caspase-like protein